MAAAKISRTEDGTAIVATDGTEWIVAKIDGKRGFRLFQYSPGEKRPDLTDKDNRPFMWSNDFDTRKEAVAWVTGAPKKNPKRPEHGLNLDEMEKRSAKFAKLLAAYFEEHGARYRIDYGLRPAGNVHDVFGDGVYTRLDGSWSLIGAYEGEVPDLSAKAEKEMLRKSKLDEFLYYDGWESCGIVKGGGCAPGTWRRWFWYEKDRKGPQHGRVYGKEPIESYVYRPRLGATDVDLEPTKRTKKMARKLAANPASPTDLVQRLKF